MNYDTDQHQHQLLNDLTDGITGLTALDQAISVLVEWGFITANLASEYIKELEGVN